MKDLKEIKNLDLLKEIAVKINSGEEKMELSDDDLENISGGYFSVNKGHKLLDYDEYKVEVETSRGPVTEYMGVFYYFGEDCCRDCGLTQTTYFYQCLVPDEYGNIGVAVVCKSCLETYSECSE